MIEWSRSCSIYLHRDPVDFRKAINGLAVVVSDEMDLSPCDSAFFCIL
ncbi:IS66 family insertion sequence element accessory protein TnpB [Teredinibacter haidensis]